MNQDHLFKVADKYFLSKDYSSAEKILNTIRKSSPRDAKVLELLSYIYLNTERQGDGFSLLKRVCEKTDASPESHYYLATIYSDRFDFNKAIYHLERAILLSPDGDFYEGLYALGMAYTKIDQYAHAIKYFSRAVRIKADSALCFYNIGLCIEKLQDYEKALVAFNEAYSINPNLNFLIGAILKIKLMTGDWTNLDSYINHLLSSIKRGEPACSPLVFTYLKDDPLMELQVAKNWTNFFAPEKNISLIKFLPKHKKIRIGYYSPDFKQHAVAYLIAGLIESHDRSKFEIYGFSLRSDTSPMRKRLMVNFDKFYDIENISDMEVVALSKKLEIDIAIDLGGHTQYSRPTIFSEKVAPIQINFLGYPGTLGTNYHDYIFADKNIIPLENQKFYSEEVIYLSCYQPNDPKKYRPEGLVKKQEHGLPENKIIYCCFCNNFKILPEVLDSWCRVLKEVKDGVLWLLEDNSAFSANVLRYFKSAGIEINRIIFAPRTSLENHLDRLALADICLDTFPYNGHTTTSDALWCGVPLITIQGQSFASRVSSSLLSYINMHKLITYSMTEYERLAISLGNIEAIQTLKLELKNNISSSNLYNDQIFAKEIEEKYSQLYSLRNSCPSL